MEQASSGQSMNCSFNHFRVDIKRGSRRLPLDFDAIDQGSNPPVGELFFSLFKFQITSKKHLFSIKMKDLTKKLKIKYRVGLGLV